MKTLRAIGPNAGIEAAYRKKLQALIAEMCGSFEYWIEAQYRKDAPLIAEDALPIDAMNKRIKELSERWKKKFNDMAKKIATDFAIKSANATNSAMLSALRDAGWMVKMPDTSAYKDVMKANIQWNVSLIKSIPEKYFGQIEAIVSNGFTRGHDLAYITEQIHDKTGATMDRAALIARDQNKKISETVQTARRKQLGITQAIWKHSHAGKYPRQSHLKADGKIYNIDEGCLIDGEYIYPGEEINCKCMSKAILPID